MRTLLAEVHANASMWTRMRMRMWTWMRMPLPSAMPMQFIQLLVCVLACVSMAAFYKFMASNFSHIFQCFNWRQVEFSSQKRQFYGHIWTQIAIATSSVLLEKRLSAMDIAKVCVVLPTFLILQLKLMKEESICYIIFSQLGFNLIRDLCLTISTYFYMT